MYPQILLVLLIIFLAVVSSFSYIAKNAIVSYLEPRTFEVVEKSEAAQVRIEAIPEPKTLFFIGISLLGIGVILHRKCR
jgi:hypothetical protein